MESSRSSKRRRSISISSNVSPSWPDLPATFESLSDDPLTTILEFVGGKSYRSFGGLNKHCRGVYLNTPGMTKETFLFGYAPSSVIIDKIERGRNNTLVYLYLMKMKLFESVGKGVVLYNRRDVLQWALKQKKDEVLSGICKVAAKEERMDILNEVWNYIDDDDKRSIFRGVDDCAARGGKLNVLKWFETKGLSVNRKYGCAREAAQFGQLHVLQWLQEEQGLKLYSELYNCACAISGGHLHVLKWLREKEVPWSEWAFILQWLQDEGCPWPNYDAYRVPEEDLKPEVIQWLRTNGYGDKISINSD